MRNLMKTIICMLVLSLQAQALADTIVTKPTTPIDFNKMIEDNNVEKAHLVHRAAQSPRAERKKPSNSKVIDFIDVEIGVGETPKVVDRRFDSVGEAKFFVGR